MSYHFLPALIDALSIVESNNNPDAVGDGGKAAGILQMHSPVVEDVNDFYGTNYAWPRDAFNPATAREICRLYLERWLKYVLAAGPVDAARIWNGGPRGHLKQATCAYWKKAQPYYAQAVCRRATRRTR